MNYRKEKENKDLIKIKENLHDMPEFVTGYIRSRANNTSASTRLSYLHDLKGFFKYLIKVNKISSIKNMKIFDLKTVHPNDIESFLEYLDYRVKNGKIYTCGRNAKARKLSSINNLFNYVIRETRLNETEENRIIENPVKYVNPIKIPEKPIKTLKKEEAQQILDNISSGIGLTDKQIAYNDNTRDRDIAIYLLFIITGLRLSEMQALNILDIDFSEKYIIIESGKGNKPRILALNKDTGKALERYLNKRNNTKTKETALFLSLQNKRMHVNTIRNVIKKYSNGKASCHKLRKTYGTLLYKETGDIQLVADTLGHSNINTTKKHYAQSDNEKRLNITRNIEII